MTEDRKTELLEKINKVASSDPTASIDPESDIKVTIAERDSYLVDILVHFVIPNEDNDDRMDVHFAACKGFINNANRHNEKQVCQKLKEICDSTLKTIDSLPEGADQRDEIANSLYL